MAVDVQKFYETKLTELKNESSLLSLQDKKYSNWRLLTFFLGALATYYILYTKAVSPALCLLPIAIFSYLIIVHQKILQRKKSNAAQASFIEKALARLNGSWQGQAMSSTHYLEEAHLYDKDLDLFGEASLFDYLATCPSRLGGDWLKSALIDSPELTELSRRQKIIQALKDKPEISFALSEFSQDEIPEESLFKRQLDWSLDKKLVDFSYLKALCLVLGASCLTLFVLWFFFQWPLHYALINLVLNYGLLSLYKGRLNDTVSGLKETLDLVLPLSASLKVLSETKFGEEELIKLQDKIAVDSLPAWQWIIQLDKALQSYENLKANAAAQPLNVIFLLEFFTCAKIDRWRRSCGDKIEAWVEVAAEFEGLNALALFAFENPSYTFPSFTDEKTFEAKALKHPLIAKDKVVANDIHISSEKDSLILISGSNMAGKSTFLRSLGINVVLANTGAPCAADSLKLCQFQLACSIKIDDSLKDGISHFYAEVLRLKQIHDLVKTSSKPVLFFFDEILHGTNSHDRLIGAGAVIKTLVRDGGLGLVTTHDLALTEIAEDLPNQARKICFVDHIENDKMHFDYKIHEGVASRGNAVRLMQLQGLDI